MKPTITSPRRFRPAALRVLVHPLALVSTLLVPAAAFGAFGYTDNGTDYVVDTGAGLVFQVNKGNGNVDSIVYNGTEYNGPSGKGSELSSGLGTATVTPQTDGSTYVMLTLQTGTTGTADPNMTQYLVVRNGEATIYMATFPGQEPTVGELRWITRLSFDLLPNGPAPSNNNGSTGAIESSDVFGHADGTTTSKYYGDAVTHGKDRAMDLTYSGATGTNVGVWMVFGNRESSSGGPFFRDIENQGDGAGSDQEIYNYMNSGHNQTEANRLNVLHGPYALVFTTGAPPTLPIDFSWMGALGLNGWVPASGRGAVSGTATGIPAGFQGVMAFANSTAQYWAVINPADGSYTCAGMKPGTYTATLYKGELGVATASVTVAAGTTTPLNLASAEPQPSVIFRIGDWDGTPGGLRNGANIPQMHPSDVRNSSWGPVTYTVGADSPDAFPAIQMRGANSPTTIDFNLASNQIAALTLRIGITCAYNSGRPSVVVNGHATTNPGASSQPSSRSFTIGTYRGNNALFTYTIPAGSLVVGRNSLTITPISGSSDLSPWLSAGWVYDSVELDGPIAAPVVTYVGGSPLVISGTASPFDTVRVLIDGATPAGSAVAAADGSWSVAYASALSAGLHSFTATASDDNGHTGPASAPFVVDTSVTMPAITTAVGDTGTWTNGATTSDRVFTFAGTAGPGATVTLTRLGVGSIGTVTADGGGNWSFDYTSVSLPDGRNSFYATASNGGANSASSAIFSLNLQGQPRISIVRYNPPQQVIPNTVGSVVFRMTFNTPVANVTTGAFSVATTATATGTVAGVSASTGTVFDVTVNGIAGTGDLKLILRPGNGITDGGGNPEAGYAASQSYTLVVPTLGSGVWLQPASGGIWSNAVNWLNAVVADGAANSADFGTLDLTADNTVHLDTPRTIGSLVFGDANPATPASWMLDNNGNAANVLTLGGATPTITVNALGTGATATISAPLAGTSGLTKAGAGTLVLTGASPLTGALNLAGGTLQVASGGSLNLGANPVAVGLSATVDVAGGAFTAGGLVSAGSSAFVIDSGSASLGGFATNSDFGGALRVNGGTLSVADVNILRNAGSSPDYGSGFIVTGGSATATTIELGTKNSYGCMSIEGGGTLTVSGPVTIANQATGGRGGAMRVIQNGTFTSTDTALGVLLCRKSGSNANNVGSATFTGGTSTAERFTLGYDSTVTAGSATITVNGGTLYLGSGGIVKNGATGLATNLNFSGGIVGAKASWSTLLPVNLPGGGNITFQTADASNQPFDITLNGAVGGAGGFTKTGGGTLTLSAANSFAGPVNLDAGVLRITGSLAGGGTVNLNGGALAGTGTVAGPVVLNTATIAPDGTNAFGLNGASLTWNGGGQVAIDLGANGVSGQLALGGALVKGTAGAYTFAFAPGAGFTAGNTYTIATFASTTFTAADFTATGLPPGYVAIFSVTGTTVQVTVKIVATVTLDDLTQAYDGTPKTPTVTTNPARLNVVLTYDGSGTAPTLPGSYAVVATVVDPSYTGSAGGTLTITVTALTTHAPTLNGDLDGSAQLRTGESLALNGSMVSGDLLVPGTPAVVVNKQATYGGTVDGSGNPAPSSYTVTLNGRSVLRHVVRRIDPIALPVVAPPPAPAGTRDVVLDQPGQSVGDFATLRNLTLNGKAGLVAVPPGTYGAFIANGGSGFVFGVAGGGTPAVYNLQGLTLNSGTSVQLVGPVILTLANGVTINSASVGTNAHLDWLTLQLATGGVTLNSGATVCGVVVAPAGTVIINSGSLYGRVSADRLIINGSGLLSEVFP